MSNKKSDVLIIGAGGAGLTAALFAKENNVNVRVLTKEYPTRSQTSMAQGGINAALGNNGEDSVEAHIANTLKSAHGMANEEAVRHLCESAPEAVAWLDSIGVCFSRTKEAKIAQRTLGGASAPRACYAQDYTGLKILHTLYDRCLSQGIEIENEKFLLEVLTNEGVVCGAKVLDIRSGEVEIYESKAVVIATGGYSRIYDKNSTNSTATTGDGVAIAKRAGAKLKDMAFVQFHPTALKKSSILISESARGAGGYLLNSKGERFTNELLPRDEVARAINAQIAQGEEVFLDIRHLGEAFIAEELPQERKLSKLYENVDPVESLIPVKPVAHYTMGGIEVDKDSMTCVNGLFAAGECANHGVHGANRLGGNSLLELVVFGKQAGESAARYALEHHEDDLKAPLRTVMLNSFQHLAADKHEILNQVQNDKVVFLEIPINTKPELDFYHIKEEIGELFYKKVGIVRSEKELLEAQEKVKEYQSKLPLMGVQDSSKIYNTNKVEFLEFVNMLDICEQVLENALAIKQSCGAHYRVD